MKIIFNPDIDFMVSQYSSIIEINQVLPLRENHFGSIHEIKIDLENKPTVIKCRFFKYVSRIEDFETIRSYHFEVMFHQD